MHYTLQACEIPANEIDGQLRVVVRNAPELEKGEVRLRLRITDSPDLAAGPENERDYRIILTGRLTRPSDWLKQFGDYSVVKHRFIIEVTGKGTYYKEWKWAVVMHNIRLLNDALYKYNNSHPGKPLTDENGIPVTFPIL